MCLSGLYNELKFAELDELRPLNDIEFAIDDIFKLLLKLESWWFFGYSFGGLFERNGSLLFCNI